jgi:hypothetical protein
MESVAIRRRESDCPAATRSDRGHPSLLRRKRINRGSHRLAREFHLLAGRGREVHGPVQKGPGERARSQPPSRRAMPARTARSTGSIEVGAGVSRPCGSRTGAPERIVSARAPVA